MTDTLAAPGTLAAIAKRDTWNELRVEDQAEHIAIEAARLMRTLRTMQRESARFEAAMVVLTARLKILHERMREDRG